MAQIKTATLSQAKAAAKPEPAKEVLEAEERKALDILAAQDEPDPDEVKAQEAKAAIAAKKAMTPKEKKKAYPSTRNRNRKCVGKANETRPCHLCQKPWHAADPRAKYCPECVPKILIDCGRRGGESHAFTQDDIEERLRPFLRIGLNLKEACLECEIDYGNIVEKKKLWPGFAEFIERQQNYTAIKAKRNLFANLAANDKETVATSKWLLERRRPDEYGSKISLEGNITTTENLSEEKRMILQALIASRQ
jgi:hypothetical protein